jgi:hypothetical protein
MRNLVRNVFIIALLTTPIIHAHSQTSTLVFEQGVDGFEGFADTSIYEDLVNNAGGDFDGIIVGTTANDDLRRGLLKIDLSSIAPGTVVVSATLQLTVDLSPPGDRDETDYDLHLVTSDWGEGETGDFTPGGQGAPAVAGDATWNANFHEQSQWTTPGGDFVAEASATAPIGGAEFVGEWASEALADDVQQWIDTPSSNFGWAILSAIEGTTQRAKRFHSSEADANGPRLTVVVESEAGDPEDIDGSGGVDAIDVQLAINGALGIDISPFSADVNNDGATNAIDVQLVINAVLGV